MTANFLLLYEPAVCKITVSCAVTFVCPIFTIVVSVTYIVSVDAISVVAFELPTGTVTCVRSVRCVKMTSIPEYTT